MFKHKKNFTKPKQDMKTLTTICWLCLCYTLIAQTPISTQENTKLPTIISSNSFLKHHLVTGETTIVNHSEIKEQFTTLESPSYISLKEQFTGLNKNFSNPELIPVADFNNNDIAKYAVKLIVTFPSGNSSIFSGAMLGYKHVLTAGRCIYQANEGGWATEVIAIPAYYDGIELYGSTKGINTFSWNEWTSNENLEWDIGLITLDRPLGLLSGGFFYLQTSLDIFDTETFNAYSYPFAPPYDGLQIHERVGTFDDTSTPSLPQYNNQIFRGEEGACISILNTDGDPVVCGVLSHGTTTSPYSTTCAVLNQTRTEDIINEVLNPTYSNRDILPISFSTSKEEIEQGGNTAANYFIYNLGNSTYSEAMKVDVYLSNDYIITTDDIFIQTINSNAFIESQNFESYDVNITIPETTPTGDYYVGIVIDEDDDYTENNNLNGLLVTSSVTIIDETILSADWLTFKVTSTPKGNNLNWTVANEINMSGYAVEYATDGKTFKEIAFIPATNNEQYNFSHTNPQKSINYYRIRQVDLNGQVNFSQIVALNHDQELVNKNYLFPNPTSDFIALNTAGSNFSTAIIDIQIFDNSGRLVLETTIEHGQLLDISTLVKGNYQVHLNQEGRQHFEQLVKL